MYEWYRQRDSDKCGGYILHEDWLLGENIQFSWREKIFYKNRNWDIEKITYRIYVRKRRGIFGCGCTDWYFIYEEDTFEEICKKLNKIIEKTDEEYWLNVIAKTDAQAVEDKKDNLESKFCGFGSKKAIGWGY
jgi:hypothetical protein